MCMQRVVYETHERDVHLGHLPLTEMFGCQTRKAKQAGIRLLVNHRMSSEIYVRSHMLKVIDPTEQGENLGM